jgi:O-antigen/teichoic acid export membrane protein
MQWRLAVGGLFGYFAFAFFIPIIFHYRGEAEAGQTGMTWTLMNVMQMSAVAWVQTRAPRFGVLVAKKDFRELDRVYFRVTYVSLGILIAASVAFELLVVLLYQFDFRLAHRMLPPLPTAVFLLLSIVHHVPRCQHFYLRAHRREPFLAVNVISSTCIGILVWVFGSRYGALGAGLSYLAVIALFVLPYQTYLFYRCRREWRREALLMAP